MTQSTTWTLRNGLTIESRSVGELDNIAYLVSDADGTAILIDAADDIDALTDLVGDRSALTIITTHQHADHWQALKELAERTSATLVSGIPDRTSISAGAGIEVNQGVWDGDVVTAGHVSLEVVGLVGHTPGSIALILRSEGEPTHIFTGDALFPGGVGKTTTADDFASLITDVETKLFCFEDDAVVHPGHGVGTTLGTERPHLPEWRQRGW